MDYSDTISKLVARCAETGQGIIDLRDCDDTTVRLDPDGIIRDENGHENVVPSFILDSLNHIAASGSKLVFVTGRDAVSGDASSMRRLLPDVECAIIGSQGLEVSLAPDQPVQVHALAKIFEDYQIQILEQFAAQNTGSRIWRKPATGNVMAGATLDCRGIAATSDRHEAYAAAQILCSRLFGTSHTLIPNPEGFVEIVSPDVSKLAAVKNLLQTEPYATMLANGAQLIAAGDMQSDEPVLKFVLEQGGTACIVGNRITIPDALSFATPENYATFTGELHKTLQTMREQLPKLSGESLLRAAPGRLII